MTLKSKIKKYVLNEGKFTFKELEEMVSNLEVHDNPSNVNPSLPRRYVVENIFIPFFNSLREKNIDFNANIKTDRINDNDKRVLSSDGIIVVNILRECKYKVL